MTIFDEMTEKNKHALDYTDEASINSSTYCGDDSCVRQGQQLRIKNQEAGEITNLHKAMGPFEKIREEKAEKNVVWEASPASVATSNSGFSRSQRRVGTATNQFKDRFLDDPHEKGRVRNKTSGTFKTRKYIKKTNTNDAFERAYHPSADVHQVSRVMTGDAAEHEDRFTVTKTAGTTNGSFEKWKITYPTPLNSATPTNEDLAHARTLTECNRVLIEEKRLQEQNRCGGWMGLPGEMARPLSAAVTIKDYRIHEKSPVKSIMHSIGADLKSMLILIQHCWTCRLITFGRSRCSFQAVS